MSVGNVLDAAAALNLHRYIEEGDNEEFQFLGSGCYRTAYLHMPSKVVYKVVTRDRADAMGNEGEFRVAMRAAAIEYDNVRIPKVSLHYLIGSGINQPILAMEYIEGVLGIMAPGNGYDHPGRDEFRQKNREVYDMHPQNYMISSDNKFVPIDMGCD